jgi:hypothetical protein
MQQIRRLITIESQANVRLVSSLVPGALSLGCCHFFVIRVAQLALAAVQYIFERIASHRFRSGGSLEQN